jgi:predicted dehydrogenase
VSLLLSLFGEPKKVVALMTERLGHGQDDISTIVAEFEGGIHGISHTSFLASHLENHIEIIGTGGILSISGFMGVNKDNLRVYLQSDILTDYAKTREISGNIIPPTSELTINAFISLLRSEGVLSLEGYGMEDAVRLTRFLERAYQSVKT